MEENVTKIWNFHKNTAQHTATDTKQIVSKDEHKIKLIIENMNVIATFTGIMYIYIAG